MADSEIHEATKMKQAATLEELETLKEALAKEKQRLNQGMEDKVKEVRSSK